MFAEPRCSDAVHSRQRRPCSACTDERHGVERGPRAISRGRALGGGAVASEHERLLAGWPKTCRVEIRGLGEALFCHATPRNDTEMFTRLTREDRLLPVFEGLNVPG